MSNRIISQDRERLQGFIEDMDTVLSLFYSDKVTPKEIRHASVHFRKLFIDRELSFVGDLLDHEIRLAIPPELPSKEALVESKTTYFQRSPARLMKSEIGDITNGAHGRADLGECHPNLHHKHVSINAFLYQRVAEFFGSSIRRIHMIQYAANYMGGAHFGKRFKNRHMDAVSRLRSILLIEVDGDAYVMKIQGSNMLNVKHETVFVENHFNPVHIELLAIARLLSESESIKSLLEKANNVLRT